MLQRRALLLGGLGLLATGIGGCGGHGDGGGDGEEPPLTTSRSVTLLNKGQAATDLHLQVNGRRIVTDTSQLLQDVEALRAADPFLRGQPSAARAFALALWAWLVRERRHFDPLTGAQWAHSPVPFMNSLGFGFCDDSAAVYACVARAAGHAARVWALDGHVVPEILVDGRWEMYDPDLEVYYLDGQGQVCGVQQLAAAPDLITAPRIGTALALPGEAAAIAAPGWVPTDRSVRYSQAVADIYASVQNNAVSPWYEEIPGLDLPVSPLRLPAAGALSLGLRPVASLVGLWGTPLPSQGALRLSLPAMRDHVLRYPLVPVEIRGGGHARIDGIEYAIGHGALAERLARFAEPVHAIELLDIEAGTTVEYLMNPTRFALHELHQVELGAAAAVDIEVRYSSAMLD